eukprot:g2180.t1
MLWIMHFVKSKNQLLLQVQVQVRAGLRGQVAAAEQALAAEREERQQERAAHEAALEAGRVAAQRQVAAAEQALAAEREERQQEQASHGAALERRVADQEEQEEEERKTLPSVDDKTWDSILEQANKLDADSEDVCWDSYGVRVNPRQRKCQRKRQRKRKR